MKTLSCRSTTNGYVELFFSDGTRKYEHRHVLEIALGRELLPKEVVHHKDGNKKNNALSNLELLSASEHAVLHGKQRKRAQTSLVCANCTLGFVRDTRHVKHRWKAGQQFFFCSKKCNGAFQRAAQIRAGIHRKPGKVCCGTLRAYRRGCRCGDCRRANTESARQYKGSNDEIRPNTTPHEH